MLSKFCLPCSLVGLLLDIRSLFIPKQSCRQTQYSSSASIRKCPEGRSRPFRSPSLASPSSPSLPFASLKYLVSSRFSCIPPPPLFSFWKDGEATDVAGVVDNNIISGMLLLISFSMSCLYGVLLSLFLSSNLGFIRLCETLFLFLLSGKVLLFCPPLICHSAELCGKSLSEKLFFFSLHLFRGFSWFFAFFILLLLFKHGLPRR